MNAWEDCSADEVATETGEEGFLDGVLNKGHLAFGGRVGPAQGPLGLRRMHDDEMTRW